MHNNELKTWLKRAYSLLSSLLPALFWLTLIFSFDEPLIAVTTLIAAFIHECGHFFAFLLRNRSSRGFYSALSGLRIKMSEVSYGDEFLIYLCGPLSNIISALLSLLLLPGDYASLLAAVNLATAFSNLMPAEGYDGYGMLRCLIKHRGMTYRSYSILEWISFFTSMLFVLLSLYLMNKIGEGYWIFFLFFISLLKKAAKMLKVVKIEE